MFTTEQFEEAAAAVRNLKQSPSNDDLLELYALYKQASVGNVNTSRPGMLDLKGKAKWDAWNGKKDLGTEDAKKQYVDKVNALVASIGLA